MMSSDNVIITTVNNVRRVFPRDFSYQLGVAVNDVKQLEAAQGEATGLFRIIRGLELNEDDNFEISKSDSLAEMLFNSLGKVNLFAIVIAFITLFGSAIGLMNIMLVSVTERTREIGIRMALGAKPAQVRGMVLRESVWIAVVGVAAGLAGVAVLTRLIKNMLYGVAPNDPLTLAGTVILLLGVALVASWIPARRAASVQPMQALRHE